MTFLMEKMMKKNNPIHSTFFATLLLILLALPMLAQKQVPPVPNPPRLVNDFAGVLSPEQQQALERKLVAYNDTTSTQIALVIEQSLEGADLFSYTQELYDTWQIGQADTDNGVLIYIPFAC